MRFLSLFSVFSCFFVFFPVFHTFICIFFISSHHFIPNLTEFNTNSITYYNWWIIAVLFRILISYSYYLYLYLIGLSQLYCYCPIGIVLAIWPLLFVNWFIHRFPFLYVFSFRLLVSNNYLL